MKDTPIVALIFREQTTRRFPRRESSWRSELPLQSGGAIENGVIFFVAPNNPKVVGRSEMVRRYRLIARTTLAYATRHRPRVANALVGVRSGLRVNSKLERR